MRKHVLAVAASMAFSLFMLSGVTYAVAVEKVQPAEAGEFALFAQGTNGTQGVNVVVIDDPYTSQTNGTNPFGNITIVSGNSTSVGGNSTSMGGTELPETPIVGGNSTGESEARNIASVASVAKIKKYTYRAKQIKPVPVVTLKSGGKKLVVGTDYAVSYGANKNAGTGTVKITGKGSYTGSITTKFTIAKAKNKFTKVTKKKVLKAAKIAKKNQTFKIAAKVKAKAKKTYKLVSVSKKAKQYVSVTKAGKVTVKKGLPKGAYKVKVRITAGATKNYKKTTVAKVVTLVVK